MTASRRAIAGGVALALAITACSNNDDADPDPITADDPAPTDNDDQDDDQDDEPGPVEDAPEDEVIETWVAWHALWSERGATGEADEGTFDDLVEDPELYAGLITGQDPEDRVVVHEVEHWTRVDIDGDQARIEDCIITLDRLEVQDEDDATYRTTWWTATAIRDGDDWLIRSHNADPTPCVAEELNDQLLTAYQDYRDAKNAAWDPPNPDHPALEATMTDDHLDFIRELLEQDAEEGLVLREPAGTENAVVFRLEVGLGVVSDCTEQDPEYGVYDLETGERIDDEIAPVEPGRMDAQSVELVPDEGEGWVVQEQAASRDIDCEPGSTDHVVR